MASRDLEPSGQCVDGARHHARRPRRDPAAAGAEVAAIHIAIYKLGGIALPLAVLFGPDALAYRLQNAGASALLTNAQGLAKIAEIRRTSGDALAGLELILSVDGLGDGALGFAETLARASADFSPVMTGADDPAMMIYTSGTTGQPKGALHAHRVLLGHMPGIELPHEFSPARRPVLDAGGLGLGRRSARLPAAEPLLRRAVWRAASTSSIRKRPLP